MAMGPFEKHLREAIELNRARAPFYAALSGGASRAISRRLIRFERLLLPLARWLDHRATPYHRAGIPLLEALFMPMGTAPLFVPHRRVVAATGGRRPVAAEVSRRIRDGYRREGFDGARLALEKELDVLSEQPCFDCMLRHLLESARRLAQVAPLHAEQARQQGLASPLWISTLLLRLHWRALKAVLRLDRRARPLQESGLAILFQDVPSIPPWPAGDVAVDSTAFRP